MTVDGCARTCMCVCGERIMLGTHTHAQCSAQRQRGNSCGAAKQQSSRWALQPAPKPPEHRLSKAWASHFQSEKRWGSPRVHHIFSLLPYFWAIIGCIGESYAWSRRSRPNAKSFQWFCVPDTLNLFHALWQWGLSVLKYLLGIQRFSSIYITVHFQGVPFK